MALTVSTINSLMEAALEQAELASIAGEVPVGAVVAWDGEIIARAHNTVEATRHISNHAEILALQAAAERVGDWRLKDCTLCVTVEPCTMCIGAIKLSRIATVVIGAMDPSMGACGSIFDLTQDSRIGLSPRVIYDVQSERCGQIMKQFFSSKR
jgi:tRNA(adenine34) deaminase